MIKHLLILSVFVNSLLVYSQNKSTSTQLVNRFSSAKYIGFHGEKVQEFNYSGGTILAGKTNYDIEMIIHGHKRKFWFPFTKQEADSLKAKDSIPKTEVIPGLNTAVSDRYYSEKVTYTLKDKKYTVYKHVDYNCYDSLCGSRHDHITFRTGITYFSPDYGLLFISLNNNMTLEILVSLNGKEAPKDLVLAILKENNISPDILKKYKKA